MFPKITLVEVLNRVTPPLDGVLNDEGVRIVFAQVNDFWQATYVSHLYGVPNSGTTQQIVKLLGDVVDTAKGRECAVVDSVVLALDGLPSELCGAHAREDLFFSHEGKCFADCFLFFWKVN